MITRRNFLKYAGYAATSAVGACAFGHAVQAQRRPNILWIYSDDHAENAVSAYGGRLKDVAPTPNIDRIAREGVLFRNSFVTNSICGPCRAVVLTGLHSHLNGVRMNEEYFDGSQTTFPKLLQGAGYETALFGKWHLGSEPTGFDAWEILPGQGHYYNPDFLLPGGTVGRRGMSQISSRIRPWTGWKTGATAKSRSCLWCSTRRPTAIGSPARHILPNSAA